MFGIWDRIGSCLGCVELVFLRGVVGWGWRATSFVRWIRTNESRANNERFALDRPPASSAYSSLSSILFYDSRYCCVFRISVFDKRISFWVFLFSLVFSCGYCLFIFLHVRYDAMIWVRIGFVFVLLSCTSKVFLFLFLFFFLLFHSYTASTAAAVNGSLICSCAYLLALDVTLTLSGWSRSHIYNA